LHDGSCVRTRQQGTSNSSLAGTLTAGTPLLGAETCLSRSYHDRPGTNRDASSSDLTSTAFRSSDLTSAAFRSSFLRLGSLGRCFKAYLLPMRTALHLDTQSNLSMLICNTIHNRKLNFSTTYRGPVPYCFTFCSTSCVLG
jgi:hypothetical protein